MADPERGDPRAKAHAGAVGGGEHAVDAIGESWMAGREQRLAGGWVKPSSVGKT